MTPTGPDSAEAAQPPAPSIFAPARLTLHPRPNAFLAPPTATGGFNFAEALPSEDFAYHLAVTSVRLSYLAGKDNPFMLDAHGYFNLAAYRIETRQAEILHRPPPASHYDRAAELFAERPGTPPLPARTAIGPFLPAPLGATRATTRGAPKLPSCALAPHPQRGQYAPLQCHQRSRGLDYLNQRERPHWRNQPDRHRPGCGHRRQRGRVERRHVGRASRWRRNGATREVAAQVARAAPPSRRRAVLKLS